MKSIVGNLLTESGVRFGVVNFDEVITGVSFFDIPVDSIVYPKPSAIIFPGLIDIAAKCMEDIGDEYSYREDYESIGLAALNGGVTFLCDMPDKQIPIIDEHTYNDQKKLASRCQVGVLICCAISKNSKPFGNHLYVVNIKDWSSYLDLDTVISRYEGHYVAFYCGAKNPNDEIIHILNVIDISNRYHINARIAVSTLEGFEVVYKAKSSGINIQIEVCLHNLYYDTSLITPENEWFLDFDCPVRSVSDRSGLLYQLRSGNIDYISSQHSPCYPSEKQSGCENTPQLDFFGSVLAYLIKNCDIPNEIIYRCVCSNPSDLIKKLTGRLVGKIEIGYEASFTIIDTKSTISRPIQSKSGWGPYDTRYLPGSPVEVYIRGSNMVHEQRVGELTFP